MTEFSLAQADAASLVPNPAAMITHFETLYGKNAQGYIIVVTRNGSGVTHHSGFPYQDRQLAAEYMAQQTGKVTVWAAFALHDEVAYRGKTRRNLTAQVVPGVCLDIDLASGVHAAAHLPQTIEEALSLVASSGVPKPTMVVHSGGGLYAYWLFDTPFVIADDVSRERIGQFLHSWYAKVKVAFEEAGYTLDKVTDLAHPFRVPGCLNLKTNPPKPVTRLDDLGSSERWSLEQLEQFLPTGGVTKLTVGGGAPVDLIGALERDRLREATPEAQAAASGLLSLVRGCNFVASCLQDREKLEEPKWKHLADLLAHVPGGTSFFHRLSQADPRYDHHETAEKLRRAAEFGPKRCETIAQSHDGCHRCPFRQAGVFASPVALCHVEPELASLQRRYVLDAKTGLYFEPETGRQKSKDDFGRSHARFLGENPTKRFENSKMSVVVDEHDYLVGDERVIVPNGDQGVLNVWREGGIPAVEGDASIWMDHMSYLVPDEVERTWFVQYLAHLLQRPSEKINSAVLIQSSPGVGKNRLADALSRMMHPNDTRIVSGSILHSRWKADMGNTRLLVLDEMQLSDLKDAENEFKPWASEEQTYVERKGIDSFRARTPRGILIFSNHDRPIAIQSGDRRLGVLKVEASKRDPEYYRRLSEEGMSDPVIAAFKHYLLNVDLQGFLAKAEPPETSAKRVLVQQSRPALELQIEWLRESRQWPFDRPVYFVDWVGQALARTYRNAINPQSLARILKRLGDSKLGPRVTINSYPLSGSTTERGYPWAWEDIEHWQAASEDELKAALQGHPLPAMTTPNLHLITGSGQLPN